MLPFTTPLPRLSLLIAPNKDWLDCQSHTKPTDFNRLQISNLDFFISRWIILFHILTFPDNAVNCALFLSSVSSFSILFSWCKAHCCFWKIALSTIYLDIITHALSAFSVCIFDFLNFLLLLFLTSYMLFECFIGTAPTVCYAVLLLTLLLVTV